MGYLEMTYGLVMICKNESENIDRFIAAVNPHISAATVVDTGSTDDTMDAMHQFDCLLMLEQRPWINFGHNRSEAFALARGTADWLLALDADMTVEIDPDFVPDPAVEAYMVKMGTADFEYRLPLLLRGDLPWRSVGAVHEYTALPDRAYVGVPTDKVRITMHGGDRSSPEKSKWHAQMLETELADQPSNARTAFYLANTYWDLHDSRALAMYERRMKMEGFVEETFYAMYRYALLLPMWPAKMQALIKAWEFRPQRLEPVYELAKELNARGQHQVAYRLASTPVAPINDNLFVHASVWRWGMDFERSIAAWWVGQREECRMLCDSLLERNIPDHIRTAVERNRAFC